MGDKNQIKSFNGKYLYRGRFENRNLTISVNKSSSDDIIFMPSRRRKKRRILPLLAFILIVASLVALVYFLATNNEKLEYIPSPADSSNSNTSPDSAHH